MTAATMTAEFDPTAALAQAARYAARPPRDGLTHRARATANLLLAWRGRCGADDARAALTRAAACVLATLPGDTDAADALALLDTAAGTTGADRLYLTALHAVQFSDLKTPADALPVLLAIRELYARVN